MKIPVGAKQVEIRELTVGEIREYLKVEESDYLKSKVIDPVSDLLLEDMSFRDLQLMTDLTSDDIDDMNDRQLNEIVTACKEWNPGFFRMARRARDLLLRLSSQISS